MIIEFFAYLFAAIMVLLGLLFRRNRLVTFLLLFYMWALIGLNTYSPDYDTYQYIYENVLQVASFEPLFILFCQFGSFNELNYQQFRMLFALVLVFIEYKAVRLYTKEINFVLSLFILFPFIFYVSGIRIGMATAIACYAFYYLFDASKLSGLKYVILIVTAASFQYVSLFYLFFLLVRFNVSTKTVFSFFILSPSLIILYYTGILYQFVNLFSEDYRILHWFENNWSERYNLLLVAIIICTQLTYLFCIEYSSRKLENFLERDGNQKYLCILMTKNGIVRLRKANYLLLLITPLYLVNIEFVRLFYGIIILEFSQMANAIFLPRISCEGTSINLKRNEHQMFEMVIMISLVLCGFVFFGGIMFQGAFFPHIFKDNMLFHSMLVSDYFFCPFVEY